MKSEEEIRAKRAQLHLQLDAEVAMNDPNPLARVVMLSNFDALCWVLDEPMTTDAHTRLVLGQ